MYVSTEADFFGSMALKMSSEVMKDSRVRVVPFLHLRWEGPGLRYS
jgi:hypothetical protein